MVQSRTDFAVTVVQIKNLSQKKVVNTTLCMAWGYKTPPTHPSFGEGCQSSSVHSIGDMVCCNGLTIKPSVFMMTKGRSSLEFPCQRPTRAQLNLWKHAVGSIMISGICLQTPLGTFTADLHRLDEWFTNADGSHIIYHMPSSGATAVYERLRARRST